MAQHSCRAERRFLDHRRYFDFLRGGYALAFHDAADDSLILARDQFGQKPLYYRVRNNTLVFASEPIALYAAGERPQMDDSALAPLAFPDPLPAGVEVRLLEARDDWARVRLANGRDVWVRASSVTAVEG